MFNAKLATDSAPQSAEMRVKRSRPYKRPWALWFSAVLFLLSFAAFIAFIVITVRMVMLEDRSLGYWALGAVGIMLAFRLLAAVQSHSLVCPLCMGPALREKTCRKNVNARRIPLLGYRAVVVLAAVFTLGFTCMYCGTPFRLRK